MAGDVAKAARDSKLDQLRKAVEELREKQLKAIDHEVAFFTEVAKARTGGTRLAKANAAASKSLLEADLNSFLGG